MSNTNTNTRPLFTRHFLTAKGVQELSAQCPDQAGMFASWGDVLHQSAEIKRLRSALNVSERARIAAIARNEALEQQLEMVRTPTEQANARVQAMIAQITASSAAGKSEAGEPSPTIQ